MSVSSSFSQFLCVVALGRRFLVERRRSRRSRANDYVGTAGTAVTIAQRVIFKAVSVYT
jgi:hypothetical protein